MASTQFHADNVQVSIQGLDTAAPSSSPESATLDVPDDDHNRCLQSCWEQTIDKQLEIADRYSHVSVLIIHWDEDLDRDLDCGSEAQELKELFNTQFHFDCRILKLNDRKRPQAQLNYGITDLILQHDGDCRSNLLIVYYTGHSFWHAEEGTLHILGRRNPSIATNSPHSPRANWNEAEHFLIGASADVLMVLDTCFSGNMFKSLTQGVRSFEVFAAAGHDEPTSPPGKHSFTRAFIDSLHEHLKKPDHGPLTTHSLILAIQEKRKFKAHHFPRYAKDIPRFIKLTPFVAEQQNDTPTPSPDVAHLTLRFAFNESRMLSEDAVTHLAKELAESVRRSKLDIRAIDWLGFKQVPDPSPTSQLGHHWRRPLNVARAWGALSRPLTLKRKFQGDVGEQETPLKKRRGYGSGSADILSPSPSGRSTCSSPRHPDADTEDDTLPRR